jgi:hypothetical protein
MQSPSKIVVPSKWDIIPLHTSDRSTFKECRRRWFWSSPAHSNLIPKQSVYGVYEPFWFGNGIHYALEHFYSPILREDPEVAFDTWYDIQWNGGIIKEEELDQFSDRAPQPQADGTYYVKGLNETLPNPEDPMYENLHSIGLGMMRFYKEYAEREDDFTVIASEHTFSVPILDPKTGEPLYMIDTRTMPEGYEPDYKVENQYGPYIREAFDDVRSNYVFEKQVHARGRMDLIVQNSNGDYVIIDHKTSKNVITEEYFEHTDLDEQCTTYIWAAELEARLYDLPYKEIEGIVYQALRKAYPVSPNLTTRGIPSINRQTETTTAELFDQMIQELDLRHYFEGDEKMQQYYTYLVERGDKQFIWRHDVRRNKAQKENAGLRIYMEAMDMLDNPRIYPNPTKNFTCLKCFFRNPCLALESGRDYEAMIVDGYEANYDR